MIYQCPSCNSINPANNTMCLYCNAPNPTTYVLNNKAEETWTRPTWFRKRLLKVRIQSATNKEEIANGN